MGIEPPSRVKTGPAAEGVLDGPGGRLDVGAVQRHQHARRAVVVDQLQFDARRAELWQHSAAAPADLGRVLVGHQAEAELGRRPVGQDGLGPFALIAAPQAVDVAASAGPSGVPSVV